MRRVLGYFSIALLIAGFADGVVAQKTGSFNETRIDLPGVLLLDSNSEKQSLTTLIQDRTVIVNFVFTTCNTICPILNATMQAMEAALSDRLGGEVILISISVDPVNDTPERLKAYSIKLGAGENWTWLTGRSADVNQVLRAFGIPIGGRPEDHPPVILVGNLQHQKWLRWVGIPKPDVLINAIDHVSNSAL